MTDDPRGGLLSGGGSCGALARSIDWSKTSLGPLGSWPASLMTTANIVLWSRFPMLLLWGDDFVQLYNDAAIPILAHGRHPAVGQRFEDCWPEAWPKSGPELVNVMRTGQPITHEDRLLPIYRHGGMEEAYFTYSYCPVFVNDGSVGGVLVIGNETTSRVVEKRRGRTVQRLRDRLGPPSTRSALIPTATEALREACSDIAFVIAYEVKADRTLNLRGATFDEETTLREIETAVRTHLARTEGSRIETSVIDLPPTTLAALPWPEALTRAFVAKIPSAATRRTAEVFVFGLNPRLPFDAPYEQHLEEVAATITEVYSKLEANEVLAATHSEHIRLARRTPMATALSTGPERLIAVANDGFREIIGRDVVGLTFAEAFPKLVGTDVDVVLDQSYRTGETFTTEEQPVAIPRNGRLEDRWLKFNVQPIRDTAGLVFGLITIAIDVTEEVLARRALEAYAAERERLYNAVDAASRAKDDFLAMLGHELRNPLAPITTALQLMKMKQPTTLVREREIIERQVGHLTKLVDDILDVARVARGKVTIHRTRVKLADVIARAVETVTPLLEQKRHVCTIDVPRDLDVEGDAMRLAQVFSNLLSNAAKYTEAGGRISTSAEREGDTIVVRVEDNGIGIPPEQAALLFDAFFQAPRGPEFRQGGLGLGLALVKSFVALHGGSVSAKNREGGGSCFEVRLPALPVEPEVVTTRPGLVSIRPLSYAYERPRVLVVDDSDDILDIVCSFLRYEGYDVMEARDPPTALRIAPSFCPNVAVLDIDLPVMNGYDLAQHLRDELGDRTPKLIAMTGYGQDDDRERARRAGFAAHLVKPVDPKDLLDSLRA
ncbi:MAG TPA: ATP-binding protein [Labilithrix sp.]|nr:ATP-binding protein [Labilithrix sp.]